jgi:hypothetical protein
LKRLILLIIAIAAAGTGAEAKIATKPAQQTRIWKPVN